MLMNPSTFDSSPRRADSREDFPAPTGPTTASRQPWGTVRFILATQEGRHDMTLVRVRPASVRKDEPQMELRLPALGVSKRTCGDGSFSQSLSSYASNHPVHISACTHAHMHAKRAHMHAHLHTHTSMLACTATHTMWAHIHTHTHKSMHIPNQSILTRIQVCTHPHHAHTRLHVNPHSNTHRIDYSLRVSPAWPPALALVINRLFPPSLPLLLVPPYSCPCPQPILHPVTRGTC